VSADERDDAVLAAAAERCACGPDVYKAQMPGYVPGDLSRVRAESVRLAAVVGRPWVVLSNGVRPEDFTAGVGEACAGGASGFLAGRAVWSGAATATNPARELRSGAVRRLHGMIDVAHRSVSAGRLR
jgi:sulfofructosephosphate aldolase